MVASIHPAPAAGAVSDGRALLAARLLRVLSAALVAGLALLIAGSVFAFGSVYVWADKPLFYAAAVLVFVALARTATVLYLRRRLGRSRFSFHSSGRWLVLDVEEPYGIRTWSFDLDRPLVPRPPLLLPGVLFAVWVVIQTIPLPPAAADALSGAEVLPGVEPSAEWRPVTVSLRQTTTGLTFLCWAIVLHVVAAITLVPPRRPEAVPALRRAAGPRPGCLRPGADGDGDAARLLVLEAAAGPGRVHLRPVHQSRPLRLLHADGHAHRVRRARGGVPALSRACRRPGRT